MDEKTNESRGNEAVQLAVLGEQLSAIRKQLDTLTKMMDNFSITVTTINAEFGEEITGLKISIAKLETIHDFTWKSVTIGVSLLAILSPIIIKIVWK